MESVNDAWRIASAIDEIKSINLGGIKAKEGSKNISKAINLLPTEIEQLQQLVGKGVEVEIRRSRTIANSFCGMRVIPEDRLW